MLVELLCVVGGVLALVMPAWLLLSGTELLKAVATDRWRRLRGHPWSILAGRLRLRYLSGWGPNSHLLTGALSGRDVRISVRDTESGRLRLSAMVMPQRWRLTRGEVTPRLPLSSELLFDGMGAEAWDAGLLDQAPGLAGAERVSVGAEGICVEVRGVLHSELGEFIAALVALSLELERRSRSPWREAAQAHRLTAQILREERALTGRGLTVRIAEGGAETVITQQVALPAGVEIRRREAGDEGGGGVRLGHPVLDGAVWMQGPRPVLSRLAGEAGCAAVLSVVHAHPGSAVRDGEIVLRVPGRIGSALAARIGDVRELAAVLESADTEQG